MHGLVLQICHVTVRVQVGLQTLSLCSAARNVSRAQAKLAIKASLASSALQLCNLLSSRQTSQRCCCILCKQ